MGTAQKNQSPKGYWLAQVNRLVFLLVTVRLLLALDFCHLRRFFKYSVHSSCEVTGSGIQLMLFPRSLQHSHAASPNRIVTEAGQITPLAVVSPLSFVICLL